MMPPPPPPPPPAPRSLPHLPQLLKLSNSFTVETSLDEMTDLIKIDPENFGLGNELELLAEAALATDPREEDFYDSDGKDNSANLGKQNRFNFCGECQSV